MVRGASVSASRATLASAEPLCRDHNISVSPWQTFNSSRKVGKVADWRGFDNPEVLGFSCRLPTIKVFVRELAMRRLLRRPRESQGGLQSLTQRWIWVIGFETPNTSATALVGSCQSAPPDGLSGARPLPRGAFLYLPERGGEPGMRLAARIAPKNTIRGAKKRATARPAAPGRTSAAHRNPAKTRVFTDSCSEAFGVLRRNP